MSRLLPPAMEVSTISRVGSAAASSNCGEQTGGVGGGIGDEEDGGTGSAEGYAVDAGVPESGSSRGKRGQAAIR